MSKPSIEKVLRLSELRAVTGYGPTQVQKKIDEDPDFPKPFKLSKNGRAVGFLESEVIAYQQKRVAERDEQAKQPPQPRAVIAPKAK